MSVYECMYVEPTLKLYGNFCRRIEYGEVSDADIPYANCVEFFYLTLHMGSSSTYIYMYVRKCLDENGSYSMEACMELNIQETRRDDIFLWVDAPLAMLRPAARRRVK